MQLDTRCPVLIFKQGRNPISHGALGIARSFGRRGVSVYAIVEDAHTPLAASRYVKETFLWKCWPGNPESFVRDLSEISKIIGQSAILIPMDDLSAIFVAENQIVLDRWFLFPKVPRDLPRQLADKARFYSLCHDLGISQARFAVPRSADELRKFVELTPFPIVVKPARQWHYDSYYNPKVTDTRQELFDIFKQNQFGELLIQEYIPGEDWIYNGYCNSKSNLYLSFTGRKLREYPVGAGSVASGLPLENQTLRDQSEAFLRAISYSGICDIDWRLDKRDGQYKMLDCNPRIGSNFGMFENDRAVDVARAQHLDLTGHKIDCTPMVEGRLFVVEPLHFRLFLRRWLWAKSTATILSPLAVTKKLAWWSVDDPLPFFVMVLRLVLAAIARRVIRFKNMTKPAR
jgi:D-aspartate ligase